jgi:RNA polymerase sigma factor (sigma-70 family)
MAMATKPMHTVLEQLRRLTDPQGAGELSDAELLERWASRRDQAAFEVLVWRHGPMVLSVCRRLVRQPSDAEDAFQATFLTLVRKAGSISKREAVAGWLHKVAYRVALAARTRAAKHAARTRQNPDAAGNETTQEVVWQDLRAVLDEEVNRLPDKYRLPVVLCYLEGLSVAEAARQLGWPRGTVGTRLAWARQRLRTRLVRRGLALSGGALTTFLAQAASAPLPAGLVAATRKAALLFAAGGAPAAGGVSPQVVALTRQSLRALLVGKIKSAAALALLLGLLSAGLCLAARQGLSAGEPEKRQDRPERIDGEGEGSKTVEVRKVRTDRHGDPLPPCALLRLGTVRFRQGNSLYSVALSPNGKVLASSGGNAFIHLWDAATGRQLHRLEGNGGMVHAVAFSPDGATLASTNEIAIRFWDVATGQEKRRLTAYTRTLAFSPDGTTLAGGMGRTIELWDVATGKVARQLTIKEVRKGRFAEFTGIEALAFSPRGKTLISGGWGGQGLRLWDVATGKELRQFKGHERRITAVAFSPDGKTLASGGGYGDHTIRLWEVATGEQIRLLAKQEGEIKSLAFSLDGKVLASAGGRGNRRLVLWDVATGREVRQLGRRHNEVNSLVFAGDGTTLVSGMGGSIRLWNWKTGQERLPFGGHHAYVCDVALSPDGRTVATAGGDKVIRLWSTASGQEVGRLEGHEGQVNAVAFSPDGRALASGSYDKTVRLWDVARAREKHRFTELQGIHALAFSPDGKVLAAGDYYHGHVCLWDLPACKLRRRWQQEGGVMALAFSPDGQTLATATALNKLKESLDARIHLWRVDTGKELRRLTGHTAWIYAVAFSPDGQLLASSGSDKGIRLWDTATGKELRRLGPDRDYVHGVAFSPDGKLLASTNGYRDQTILLWEVATGRERLALPGHRDYVHVVAFSRDGRTLVSGGMDTTALVWDVTGLRTAGGRPAPLSARRQQELWTALARKDAQQAHRAVWSLVARGPQTVRFVHNRLRPLVNPDPRRLARSIADLDSKQFAVRNQAMTELEKWAELAVPALKQALAGKPTLEVRRRVERLLQQLAIPSGERLRRLRAVEVLEQIGSPEARQVLRALAQGTPLADLTRDAAKAVKRLARRAGKE